MVSHLIDDVGYPWTMRICGFLILALLIFANLTVRPFYEPRPHKITMADLRRPFTEPNFVFLLTGFFIFTFGFFAPVTYIQVQALSAGMSPDLAQYMVPILNAASLFGRLFAGFTGDRIGRFNIFITVCFLTAIWILGLWLPDSSNAALIAFAALFGFSSGAFISLITPLVMEISPITEIGFRAGLVLSVSSIGALTTNPINGAILDSGDGWDGPKIFSGVFCMVGTVLILVTRVRLTGWKLLEKV
jgi:MFS family permease